MPENSGQFTETDLHSVERPIIAGETPFEAIVRTLSAHVKDASPQEVEARKRALELKRHAHESWGFHVGRDIEPGGKHISDDLDIKPLILAGVLCSEEWKRRLLHTRKGTGVTSFEELQSALEKDRYIREAVETINHVTELRLQRIEQAPHGVLTHGLEIEIDSVNKGWATYRQQRNVERLQDLGLEVTYDGLREIVLGKSLNISDQMTAVEAILKMGLVTKDQALSIHYTMGGFTAFNAEFYVLDQIMEASGIGRNRQAPGERLMVENNPAGNKPLYEDKPMSPMGLPFKQRTRPDGEGVVVELRWAGTFKEYSGMVKYIETTAYLAEAMEQWTRREHSIPGYNPELAEAWDILKSKVDEVFTEAGLLPLHQGLDEYLKDQSSSSTESPFPEAVSYSKRVAIITNRTHLSPRHQDADLRAANTGLQESYEKITHRRELIQKAVLETRRKVREVLTS